MNSIQKRELLRVYLSNVKQICKRFVEEKRGSLEKLIEDKTKWSIFCSFWSEIDLNSRRLMSKEKSNSILKLAVKQFFVEKEVASTLRAAVEPLPPNDDKGSQNRTKDGGSGDDFSKESIERDERRLTEVGRRTIELFVLSHIFSSKIEVDYQEAVALKRQDELIREEEAEWMTGAPSGSYLKNKITWLSGRSLVIKTAKGHDVESSYYFPLEACFGGTHSRRWIPIEKRPTWPSRATLGSKELAIVTE
ncbi:hypothetical protein Tco_0780499 [Tanacetum coccineum]